MKKSLLILLVVFTSLSFAEFPPNIGDLISDGSTHGTMDDYRQCYVRASHGGFGETLFLSIYSANSVLPIARFGGRQSAMGGGGCLQIISQNNYELHFSNGPNPTGPPNFCSSRLGTPGGVRFLIYNQKVKVEILDGDGELKAHCNVYRIF